MKSSTGLALRLGVGAALGLLLFDLVQSGRQMGWGAMAPGDALGITAGVAVGFFAGRRWLAKSSYPRISARPWIWGIVGFAAGLAFMAIMDVADAPNRIGLFETIPGLRGLWAELILGGWTGGALGSASVWNRTACASAVKRTDTNSGSATGGRAVASATATSDMGNTPSAHSKSSLALGVGFGIGGGLGAFVSMVIDGENALPPALLYALAMAVGMLLAFSVWKRVAQVVSERLLGRPRNWIWIGAAAGFAMCTALWASWSLQFTMFDLFDSPWASFFIAALVLGLWNAFLLGCVFATRFAK